IPADYIKGGSKVSNLREAVLRFMKEKGMRCRCIRCREPKNQPLIQPTLKIRKYRASKGTEYFLSIEEKDGSRIGALLRLRIPYFLKHSSSPPLPELKESALVREIHTYGQALPLGARQKKAVQHRGWGAVLLKKAEEIAKKEGAKRMAIISGVGVREYFRKFGYQLLGTYMAKEL
ncbi:GNAT family N-acetyltransferase, partial [bacterium]|nr:GNAT family N-acetyltransferase [bacterium]